jgi:hypothetical protein
VQLVEQETRYQAEKLDLIGSGKCRELHLDEIWVPDIPLEYYNFMVIIDKKEKEETSKLTKKTRNEKKRKEDKYNDVEVEVNQPPLTPVESIVENGIGYPKHIIKALKRSFRALSFYLLCNALICYILISAPVSDVFCVSI